MIKKCKGCGIDFTPSKFRPDQEFHSKECQKSAYMKLYNVQGARRRGALPKEPCPLCGKITNKWIKTPDHPEHKRVCFHCAYALHDGKPVASSIFSVHGGAMHGRGWWIGKKLGKMTVVDIPFEPLCYGRHTETEVTLACPLGHQFKKPVCEVTSVCPECLKINKQNKENFKKIVLPYEATFNEWKKMWFAHTGCELLDAPENVWKKDRRLKVKAKCWCGREFEPTWCDVNNKKITSCGCLYNSSQANEEIYQLMMEKGIYAVPEYPVSGRFIDVYVPGEGLAIEYQGLRWHEEKQDLEKYNICTRGGLRYLGVYEDEWIKDKDRCTNLILEHVGRNGSFEVDYPKISFSQAVDVTIANEFIEKHSFEKFGTNNYNLYIGAYYNNELIALMVWDDTPLAPNLFLGACFNHAYKVKADSIYRLMWDWGKEFCGLACFGAVAHVQARLDWDGVFKALGFELIANIQDEYFWIKNGARKKFEMLPPDDKWKRLYGCGEQKWVYKSLPREQPKG